MTGTDHISAAHTNEHAAHMNDKHHWTTTQLVEQKIMYGLPNRYTEIGTVSLIQHKCVT